MHCISDAEYVTTSPFLSTVGARNPFGIPAILSQSTRDDTINCCGREAMSYSLHFQIFFAREGTTLIDLFSGCVRFVQYKLVR